MDFQYGDVGAYMVAPRVKVRPYGPWSPPEIAMLLLVAQATFSHSTSLSSIPMLSRQPVFERGGRPSFPDARGTHWVEGVGGCNLREDWRNDGKAAAL